LSLPGELRNIIYKFVLCGHIIHIRPPVWLMSTTFNSDATAAAGGTKDKFALVRVCREIHHETDTMLYAENMFVF
ncbi:hypothetical protein K491DRAFT_578154, partial [Lophiostoma macrostomum CBS 122681]